MIKRLTALLALGLLLCSSPLLAADMKINQQEFDQVINTQCVKCHTRERIDNALQRGEKIDAILEKMMKFGVQLSESDRSVLAIFADKPLK